jgi:hypothetical protein
VSATFVRVVGSNNQNLGTNGGITINDIGGGSKRRCRKRLMLMALSFSFCGTSVEGATAPAADVGA